MTTSTKSHGRPSLRRVKAILSALLGLAIIGYAAIAAMIYLGQRHILFMPDTTRPDVSAVAVPDARAVTLRVGQADLLAWWLPPPSAVRPVVLYFHGNGGNLGDRAGRMRALAKAGFGVLMPEYPGYGSNPGAPSEQAFFATAAAALTFLAAHDVGDGQVAIYGESLGTGVAAWVASGRRFGALILESPFTSVTALAADRYWYLPVGWLARDPFDTIDRIGGIKAPLLVAQGARDEIVPPAMGRAVLAAAPAPKQLWVAPEGGHEDLAEHGLLGIVTAFIEREVGGADSEPRKR